jgi:hypothetical protein
VWTRHDTVIGMERLNKIAGFNTVSTDCTSQRSLSPRAGDGGHVSNLGKPPGTPKDARYLARWGWP